MTKSAVICTVVQVITAARVFTTISTQPASNYVTAYNDYVNFCAPAIECDASSKYRSINGSCNNLKIPWLGAANTPHLRLVDAYYDDGDYQFRKQTDGNPLPNARLVQLHVFLYKQFPYWNDHNVLFMEWGQFIAHDTTHLPPDVSVGSDCCELQKEDPVSPQCREVIPVPANDGVYLERGQTCINFNRAVTSARFGCPLKPATFMVQTTHFIDGSHVYGSDEELAANLRSFVGGRLRSDFYGAQQEFCPQKNRTSWKCDTSKHSELCFVAGDPRVNQNLGIAVFQNLFLRFHNAVATRLYNKNPFWCDETVYQEARRIVVAVLQHITYAYYLPVLLGEEYTAIYGFSDQTVYDEMVNPSTSQEHSTGAFRILHSQIPAVLNLIDENHYDVNHVILTDWMDKPDILPVSNNFDRLLRGFQETPTRIDQPSYNPLTTPKFVGHDLLTTDIQRGRDTGVPPYNRMRSYCGMPEAKAFEDLIGLIAYEDVQQLKQLYSDVGDIDLIVGALLEIPAEGAKVGPTSRCIIADNFNRSKIGDRFFYDVPGQPGSFTPEQLQILKYMNLGHVICATSKIQYLPKDVFMPMNSKINARKYSCDNFALNFDAWKDYSY